MRCRDIMRGGVMVARCDDTVAEVATLMEDARIGFLPVCDDAGRLLGVVTDRDIALRVLADGGMPSDTAIAHVMSPGVIGCGPDEEVERAESLMRKHQISRIVVVDASRRPIGVISLADLAQFDDEGARRTLRQVAERELAAIATAPHAGTTDASSLTMSSASDLFERTVQEGGEWIWEIASELDVGEHLAWRALRAVLHALRDRLTPVEAADLAAQMPVMIRGLYYEGWTPVGKPTYVNGRDEFLALVQAKLPDGLGTDLLRDAVDAVFRLLNRHISQGELADVRECLPHDIRAMWPLT